MSNKKLVEWYRMFYPIGCKVKIDDGIGTVDKISDNGIMTVILVIDGAVQVCDYVKLGVDKIIRVG